MASARLRRRAVNLPSQKTQPRATRLLRTRSAVHYAENDSDADNDSEAEFDSDSSEDDAIIYAAPSRSLRSRTNSAGRRTKRSRPQSHAEESDYEGRRAKRHKRSATPKGAKYEMVMSDIIQGNGVIPDWAGLEHEILVQIFRYAFTPLYDPHQFHPFYSVQQLLGVAHLCKAFADAALRVLYESPPLVPMDRAHLFTNLMMADPGSLKYASDWSKRLQGKYRPWVKALQIDVHKVAEYSLQGSGHLDLGDMVKNLPQLAELELYHEYDMPPYRDLDRKVRWQYPKGIFDALGYVDPNTTGDRAKTTICALESWRWSSRLAGTKYPIQSIKDIHLKPSFASLNKIAFVNYQPPLVKKDEEDPKHESILAEAIKALKQLKHLIFESSALVNTKLLPLLPNRLEHFELINCWDVKADDVASFLLTHGYHLRSLTLNHNKSLGLSFLPVLAEGCPRLEALHMNLTYFNVHATYHDSEPEYDQLLLPEQIPNWPSTMRTIELTQLRKWERNAAEVLFQSLVDSAGDLPDLRSLTIQAILNIGWQDRASFRKKWSATFDRVFKRVSEPPKLVTAFANQSPRAPEKSKASEELDSIANQKAAAGPTRRSLQSTGSDPLSSTLSLPTPITGPTIISKSKKPTKSKKHPKPAEPPSEPPRRTTRSTRSKLISYAESPEISEVESNSDSDSEDEEPPRPATRSRDSRRERKTHNSDSDSEHEEPPRPATRSRDSRPERKTHLQYEIEALERNARLMNAPLSPVNNSDEDSENDSSDGDAAKEGEVVQGMCDVVDVRIDNLRPTENPLTEADFLDAEVSGDESWDEEGESEDEDRLAW